MGAEIFILRHVDSIGNKEGIIMGNGVDSPLTKDGIRHAVAVANSLKDRKIEVIYAGPSKRSKDTARVFSHILGCDVIITDNLKARDYGSLAGKKYSDIGMEKSEMTGNDSLNCIGRFKDAEPIKEVKKRLSTVLGEIENSDSSRVLIIGHGFLNSILSCLLRGLEIKSELLYRQKRGEIASFKIDDKNTNFIPDIFNKVRVRGC